MAIVFSGGFIASGFTIVAGPAGSPPNTEAWFGGGRDYFGIILSTINRITYATDTNTASVRGPLSSVKYQHAAASNIQ